MRKAIECDYVYIEYFDDTLKKSKRHKLDRMVCYEGEIGSNKYYDNFHKGMELIKNINIPFYFFNLENVEHEFDVFDYKKVELEYIVINGVEYKISRNSRTVSDFLNCDLVESK